MALPSQLREAVESELAGLDRSRVTRAAEQISSDYKAGNFRGSLSSPESRAAYLVTRLPATYATCEAVFDEVSRRMAEFSPEGLLDLGAGPGTASWAAAERWPSLRKFCLVESNREFADLGRRLGMESSVLSGASWVVGDVQSQSELPKADVVVMAYSLGEFRSTDVALQRAWAAAKDLLVIIVPGTPRNFARVAKVRQQLIASGGAVVAPCPHELQCPMAGSGDWCHFAVRLERSAEHRRMKRGALGYEDEKFSYLAIAKRPSTRAETRIVRHPMTHSGYIELTLCTGDGLQQQTITRSKKDAFRAARRAKWGDEWRQLE